CSGVAANLAYGAVPEFTLTESGGPTGPLLDLQGNEWIADFIFTLCACRCPAAIGHMRSLQATLPPESKLISFSIGPQRDTPDVLARYAKEFHADPQRWMFVTGNRQTLYNVSVKGFKLSLDDSQRTEQEPITHSSRFVLVDRDFQIQDYY